MKKIFFITLLGLGIVSSGCKKLVDEKPLSDGTLENFYKNRFDAEAGMAGMYGGFQRLLIGEKQFFNRYTYWGDARADNFERFKTYSKNADNEMHFNTLTANNEWGDWSPLYQVIGRANLLIKKLPEVNTYTQPGSANELPAATLKSYMAECYAMRAMSYFYIARVWGGAPIRTEPYESIYDDPEQARDSEEKVLNQVISDLTMAYNTMAKGATAKVFYISEAAVCAMMADVYMWKKDYPNAIIWSKRLFAAKGPTGKVYNAAGATVTGSGGAATDLQPTATWKDMFVNPASSVEAIWNIHWDYAANGCACMAGISTSPNNTPYRISEEIFTKWSLSTTDIRVKQSFDINTKTRDRTWKWYPGVYTPGLLGAYTYAGTFGATLNVLLPMYRLSDQYLLYAEALNKTGDQLNALKYLNLIHVRAGLVAYTANQFPTAKDLETAILQERQLELFAEGKRWFDLVRTDRVAEFMDPILITRQIEQGATPVGWGTDKRRYFWPINRNVLNSNSLLVQNQPYSE
ncbi:RagB/SusD family nutrient uptake outer membrane protein [Pedobacter sp. PLR]|uniref:RagB/SusD family nutrient uptake outer membrane protein n=1 Tax=Pedobacter sp. PLR TaxID=2994465 RepID=UPI002245668C|nr:RagB/SusD family nutrient uptake outer membrane protein [Pedobacter sp. PLR]MCX2450300.1 RagB/SusD family nutrient uptake outer membrane protein [Pedobacter sp. PLR]